MKFYDWLIVIVPLCFVLWVGNYTRRYVRSVADFLSAGRLCGRYIIMVGDIAMSLSIIGLVAYVEVQYKTGFALVFWQTVLMPLTIILSLGGYCIYRFRETKAMSIGQFLEMRYSRRLRIFAAALRSISEVLANMIMPAVAARFFIYFLGLPTKFTLLGFSVDTFSLIMVIVLTISLALIFMGGTLALVVTDAVQGMICYPLLVVFVVFILCKFSWSQEIVPVMQDRVAGESFLDPYDIDKLRDFNLFFLFATLLGVIFHRISWIGGGASSSARSPQEQKMAGLLGVWRGALGTIFYVLIAIAILTVMNHRNHAQTAHTIRLDMASRIANDIVEDPAMREAVKQRIAQTPVELHQIGVDAPRSEKNNADTPYLDAAYSALKKDKAQGNALFQQFRTLYYQMMMASTLRHLLPPGLLGLFALLMVFLMVSTDDTRIFLSSVTIAQDVILPLRKKPFTPTQHIWTLRLVSLGVGIVYFCGSSFMSQLDYINLFLTLMTTMWTGGCGPVLIFGLYSRFGTVAGAWTSLITSIAMALSGMFIQRNWADVVYPWLAEHNWVEPVGSMLKKLSRPFEPYIVWDMNPIKCPVNSFEFYVITMLVTLILYCVVSKLTCRQPFNLDRMLHRGKYDLEGNKNLKFDWNWKSILIRIVGITPEYTRGDKITAWVFFVYSFIYKFLLAFVGVVIWNAFAPWPIEWWGIYFFIVTLFVPGIMAAVTAVWFGIGGARDLVQMFKDLRARSINELDDGRVEGNMSLADKAQLEAVDKKNDQIQTEKRD